MVGTELLILIGSGVVLLAITLLFNRSNTNSIESLLAADRNVGFGQGSLSILATHTAPPAILVSSQLAFDMGLSGAFWFTVPNVLTLTLFAYIAPRIKDRVPEGYTIAQLFDNEGGKMYKLVSFYTFLFCTLIMIQSVVGGAAFLTFFADISRTVAVVIILAIIVSYSLISGLKASILTDVVQIAVLGILLAIIVPWTISAGGGVSAASQYVTPGNWGSIVAVDALLFGIHISALLFVAPIIGVQFWQRVYAMNRSTIKRSWIVASLLFAFIPISLATLGLMAKAGVAGVEVNDSVLAGYDVINAVLPVGASAVAFLLLITALLSSADSGLVGSTSVLVVDLADTILERDYDSVLASRISMIGLAIMVGLFAVLPISLLQWLLLNAPIGVILVPPIIMELYSSHDLSSDQMFYACALGSVISFPTYLYASLYMGMGQRVIALLIGASITTLGLVYLQSQVRDPQRVTA